MGLATPVAVLVATGRAALKGILVRDAAALEAAGQADICLLDKTGTVTTGRFEVAVVRVDENQQPGLGQRDLLRLAASVEQLSQHPLAKAIVARAREWNLKLDTPNEFASHPGLGAEAVLNGSNGGKRDDGQPAAEARACTVVVGSPALLVEKGIDLGGQEDAIGGLSAAGQTVVAVAMAGQPLGLIGMRDVLRPNAAEAVRRIEELGLEVELITGDSRYSAVAVAGQLSLSTVHAEVRPEGKVRRVIELQADGRRVIMVGDGINDAAALAAATAGVAFGAGADIARQAADITLVGDDPALVAATIRLSRRSVRIIKQNLFWAFAYNMAALPLAAIGWIPAWVGAAAMALSSLTVVGNSLRAGR
jgi:Cu+-exporting ATPase